MLHTSKDKTSTLLKKKVEGAGRWCSRSLRVREERAYQASPSDVIDVSLAPCERCWRMSMLGGGASIVFLEVTAGIQIIGEQVNNSIATLFLQKRRTTS